MIAEPMHLLLRLLSPWLYSRASWAAGASGGTSGAGRGLRSRRRRKVSSWAAAAPPWVLPDGGA